MLSKLSLFLEDGDSDLISTSQGSDSSRSLRFGKDNLRYSINLLAKNKSVSQHSGLSLEWKLTTNFNLWRVVLEVLNNLKILTNGTCFSESSLSVSDQSCQYSKPFPPHQIDVRSKQTSTKPWLDRWEKVVRIRTSSSVSFPSAPHPSKGWKQDSRSNFW